MYNPDFKPVEFEGFRKQAGLNSFVLTPKRWIEATNVIGIISKLNHNLESINAVLIRQGLSPQQRLQQLNTIAITQMTSLNHSAIKKLDSK